MASPDEDNTAAAEQGFLELFDATAKQVKDEQAKERKEKLKENLGSFLKGFNSSYKTQKSVIMRAESGKIEDYIFSGFTLCRANLNSIISARKNNYEGIKNRYSSEAETLGTALGFFLASVEYGIANNKFKARYNPLDNGWSENINYSLKSLSIGIRPTFISNRIKAIAKRNPNLDEYNRKFLAYMAAVFSK